MQGVLKATVSFTDFLIKDGAYLYRGIFAQFMTMREKEILARTIEIH